MESLNYRHLCNEDRSPPGWWCSCEKNHSGPCAAWPGTFEPEWTEGKLEQLHKVLANLYHKGTAGKEDIGHALEILREARSMYNTPVMAGPGPTSAPQYYSHGSVLRQR